MHENKTFEDGISLGNKSESLTNIFGERESCEIYIMACKKPGQFGRIALTIKVDILYLPVNCFDPPRNTLESTTRSNWKAISPKMMVSGLAMKTDLGDVVCVSENRFLSVMKIHSPNIDNYMYVL